MTRAGVHADELRSWPVFVRLPAAADVFGIAHSEAYKLARQGQFPVEVVRIGTRLRCRTADLIRAVALDAPTSGTT